MTFDLALNQPGSYPRAPAPGVSATFADRVALYQAASVALDTWACNGKTGRRKDDPVYREVTQDRDYLPSQWPHYSSCADRAHWKLWRLGCRLPFVNRSAPAMQGTTGPIPARHWLDGVNISNLWNSKLGAPVLRRPGAGWTPLPGDELLLWNTGNDAHSCAIVDYLPNNELATTANYGAAGMAPTPFGGCHFSDSPLYFNGKDWLCGQAQHRRIVQSVLRMAALVPLFTEAPDLSGPDWSDTFTGEVADALGASKAGPR